MARKNYFPADHQAPPPLAATAVRKVRFEEVDTMQVVWHGRYPSYFEDARTAFGDTYGLSYAAFVRHRVMAPIAQMHIDYRLPLRLGDNLEIEARLHWNEAMRLDFSYSLLNGDRQVCATGYTVQLLTDIDGSVVFIPPPWIKRFREKWQQGGFTDES